MGSPWGTLCETWIHARERDKGDNRALQGEHRQMLLAAGFGALQEPGRAGEMGFSDGVMVSAGTDLIFSPVTAVFWI